jgi:hypothetical protein
MMPGRNHLGSKRKDARKWNYKIEKLSARKESSGLE